MFCTKCGENLEEDTKFCPSCGTEQKSVAADEENKSVNESGVDVGIAKPQPIRELKKIFDINSWSFGKRLMAFPVVLLFFFTILYYMSSSPLKNPSKNNTQAEYAQKDALILKTKSAVIEFNLCDTDSCRDKFLNKWRAKTESEIKLIQLEEAKQGLRMLQ
jgi:hypothetical protein